MKTMHSTYGLVLMAALAGMAQQEPQRQVRARTQAQSQTEASVQGENPQTNAAAEMKSATQVEAVLVEGRMNPTKSRAGDTVLLKLKEDAKSEGRVLLKKGSTVEGVIREARQLDAEAEGSGEARSVVRIDWIAPAVEGQGSQYLAVVLRSVSQVSPLAQGWSDDLPALPSGRAQGSSSSRAGASGSAGGGLVGGVAQTAGGVAQTAAGATGNVAGSVGGTAAGTLGATATSTSQGVLDLGKLEPIQSESNDRLMQSLGLASDNPMFQVGRGELINPIGVRQSLEVLSQFSNDTMLVSKDKSFDIRQGARMVLMVGIRPE